ncbi:MAG: hypothetical protein V4805_07585 [Pseudomonadota bacterium]
MDPVNALADNGARKARNKIQIGKYMTESASFVVVLLFFFGFFVLLMRWLTGWSQLEKNYKAIDFSLNQQISEGSYRWVKGDFKFSQLILAVELYPTSLWFRPSFPLNFLLTPLSIPWEDICEAELSQNFFLSKVTLRVLRCPFAICIHGETGKRIHAMFRNRTMTMIDASKFSLSTVV